MFATEPWRATTHSKAVKLGHVMTYRMKVLWPLRCRRSRSLLALRLRRCSGFLNGLFRQSHYTLRRRFFAFATLCRGTRWIHCWNKQQSRCSTSRFKNRGEIEKAHITAASRVLQQFLLPSPPAQCVCPPCALRASSSVRIYRHKPLLLPPSNRRHLSRTAFLRNCNAGSRMLVLPILPISGWSPSYPKLHTSA